MSVSMRSVLSGPAFNGKGKPSSEAVMRGIVREAVETGSTRLLQTLRPRPAGVYLSVAEAGRAASVGNYRRNLNNRFARRGLTATLDDGGVVYGPWLEGTSRRNQTTRFKGYASFRRTKDWLNKSAVPKIIRAHLGKLRRGLGGR